jgi:ribonuclease E
MTKHMLIDAAHKEELRVVVMNDDKIEDFEVETAGKEQIKGNIYVAEVTRVEPSLQAAFVNYGGNRNGFLAFSEIHPAYFQLDAEERQALLDELTEIANRRKGRDQEVEEELEKEQTKKTSNKAEDTKIVESVDDKKVPEVSTETEKGKENVKTKPVLKKSSTVKAETPESLSGLTPEEMEEDAKALAIASTIVIDENTPDLMDDGKKPNTHKRRGRPTKKPRRYSKKETEADSNENETVTESNKESKDTQSKATEIPKKTEEKEERRLPIHRRYSIDQVLKEGQRILIQVNKEERGNKGAAISTYISLPGRYSVLMPNTPYAGGISRKITDFSVRREIKSIVSGLKVPDSMGVIIRTAGVGQEPESLEKDVDNLLSLWKKIDTAYSGNKKPPFVVHEDGSLAVRAIRDMYNDEIDEVQVSNRKTYRIAKDYMKSLMPESAKKVKEYKLQTPIFTHFGVEEKLNRLHTTRVNLPSGGYLIINPTEALVSIDVNSGKSTQEKNIEETALKTNLEAAEEVCRQLRLRDLAGLVVIDFIDMEDTRNERAVERMMRKCVRKDRARIQIAPISTFGLLEMSRQRLRPSLGESTMQACSHCNGTGLVASLASAALALLRSLEDENIRSKAERVIITTSDDLALYILNHKRELVKDMEARYGFSIFIRGDDQYHAPDHKIEVIRTDNRGVEKRQAHEVILREPLDDDESKNRNRRRGRKPNKKEDTHQNKGKSTRKPREHKNDDSKQSEAKTTEASGNKDVTSVSPETDEKKDTRRRSGGRSRHLRRNSRRPTDDKAEGSTQATESAKSETTSGSTDSSTSTEKRNMQDQARKNTADTEDRKAKPRPRHSHSRKPQKEAPKAEIQKGIVVEHVTATGQTSVGENKSESVTGKFQRWWSKTTS